MWISLRRYLPDKRTVDCAINTDNICFIQEGDGPLRLADKETCWIKMIDGSELVVDAEEWMKILEGEKK